MTSAVIFSATRIRRDFFNGVANSGEWSIFFLELLPGGGTGSLIARTAHGEPITLSGVAFASLDFVSVAKFGGDAVKITPTCKGLQAPAKAAEETRSALKAIAQAVRSMSAALVFHYPKWNGPKPEFAKKVADQIASWTKTFVRHGGEFVNEGKVISKKDGVIEVAGQIFFDEKSKKYIIELSTDHPSMGALYEELLHYTKIIRENVPFGQVPTGPLEKDLEEEAAEILGRYFIENTPENLVHVY